MTDYIIPGLLAIISLAALRKKADIYSAMLDGAGQGLKTLVTIIPSLVMLLSAVHLFRASGAIGMMTDAVSPLFRRLGIPPELLPLMLVRPISGSAALAVGADLIAAHGPDSLIGRTAAVMLGSTETTFYTISVYFGAAGIHHPRHTIPAALIADCTGFLMACLSVRLFFP